MNDQHHRPQAVANLMEQDRRVLLEARMLPETGPLTPEMRQEVITKVREYLDKHRLTKAYIAQQTGLGKSTMTDVLNDRYDHSGRDDALRKVNDWMEDDARRRARRPSAKFVETAVARRIRGAANRAKEGRMISICYGPAGIGKTFCAEVLASTEVLSTYIRLSADESAYSLIRRNLIDSLRVKWRLKKTPGRETVSERLRERLRGSERLLIIDEAHLINDRGLQFLRDLHDECGVPILMLGVKDLMDRIERDADEDHGQFNSRVGCVIDLTDKHGKMPGDKHPLFTRDDIQRLFQGPKVKLHPSGTGYLMDIANHLGKGSLRRCRVLVSHAIALVQTDEGPLAVANITDDMLRQAESELCGTATRRAEIEVREVSARRATV